MSKISRRDLLRAGAGGTAAAGLLAATPRIAGAGEAIHGVHVHAVFPDAFAPGDDLVIDVTALGDKSDLSGTGWDFESAPAVGTPSSGACLYTQRGKFRVRKTRIELSGFVLFSNDPTLLDVPVTTVADTATGEVDWTFGEFPFSGTGTVVVF